ncbi:hypothetical protein [Paenibacillus sp. LjRoot56]|uniref:hypothetical protein n=1 Tax=Paenibacillus sp. LjRoot56 TaxID=3342333 RepID=UPI003ECFF7AC
MKPSAGSFYGLPIISIFVSTEMGFISFHNKLLPAFLFLILFPTIGTTVTYSVYNLSAGAVFDPVTAKFSWTPQFKSGAYP